MMNDAQFVNFVADGEFVRANISPEQLGFTPQGSSDLDPFNENTQTNQYDSLPQIYSIGMQSKFSPRPYAVVIYGSNNQKVLVAVAGEAGWHLWNFAEFQISSQGAKISLDLEGHSDLAQVLEHVKLRLVHAESGESDHNLLARGLQQIYPKVRKNILAKSNLSWWSQPIYCGWGDQVSTAMWMEGVGPEARAITYCTQGLHERWVARLDEANVPFETIIIDNGWSPAGTWEPDVNKWPDLRRFIDKQHQAGRKVLLWLAAWLWEGIPDEWCIFAGDEKLTVDPTNPKYREFVRKQVHRLLSPDGFNADGFKIDQLSYCPTQRKPRGGAQFGRTNCLDEVTQTMKLYDQSKWGCELMYLHQKDIYDAAKSAKPDCLITSSTVHPYFYDSFDIVRLHDTGLVEGDVIDSMRSRADVVSAALPGMPIDADDWVIHDYDQWMDYTSRSHMLGVPCIFYTERFMLNFQSEPTTYKIPLEDLRTIGKNWLQAGFG